MSEQNNMNKGKVRIDFPPKWVTDGFSSLPFSFGAKATFVPFSVRVDLQKYAGIHQVIREME